MVLTVMHMHCELPIYFSRLFGNSFSLNVYYVLELSRTQKFFFYRIMKYTPSAEFGQADLATLPSKVFLQWTETPSRGVSSSLQCWPTKIHILKSNFFITINEIFGYTCSLMVHVSRLICDWVRLNSDIKGKT